MKVTLLDIVERELKERKVQQKWAEKNFDCLEDGHFAAVSINDKECLLAPYPEFNAFLYRGQAEFYDPCYSSLYRGTNRFDRFIAKMRIAEFQLLISDHPAVIDFNQLSVMGLRCKIDYEGLAQHYELQTSLLDFTSNPLVAAFFACCKKDKTIGEYRPIFESKHEGVFYRYFEAAAIGDPSGPDIPHSSIIGLQPLHRPGVQYAYCYRLPYRASLNSRRYVSVFKFVHDPKVSTKIFEYFEGGSKLFPYDPVAEKAKLLSSTMEFSKHAFDVVWGKSRQLKKRGSFLKSLKRKGIIFHDETRITFTKAEIAEIKKEWELRRADLESRIHCRRACYPI